MSLMTEEVAQNTEEPIWLSLFNIHHHFRRFPMTGCFIFSAYSIHIWYLASGRSQAIKYQEGQKGKKSQICLEGQSMIPQRGNFFCFIKNTLLFVAPPKLGWGLSQPFPPPQLETLPAKNCVIAASLQMRIKVQYRWVGWVSSTSESALSSTPQFGLCHLFPKC